MKDNLNKDMDNDTLEIALTEIVKSGIRRVVLSGFGEPLLHPRVDYVIETLSKNNIKIVLNTNAILLEKHLDLVLDHVHELAISLDCFYRIRGTKLEDMLNVLEYIRDYKLRHGKDSPVLTAYVTVTKYDLDKLDEFIHNVSKAGFTSIKISNIIPIDEHSLNISCMLDHEANVKVKEVIDRLARRALGESLRVEICNISDVPLRRCPYVANKAVYISVDGLITPCMYYSHNICTYIEGIKREIKRIVFGDVREGLLNVWSKLDYVKFRFTLTANLVPTCFNCRLKWYCPLTLSNMEDCLGNSPTCAHCPFLHGLASCPV